MPVHITRDGLIATVTLDRPDVHNAFDAATIEEVRIAFESLSGDAGVRVIVLTGAGESFCAGGDMRWMQRAMGMTFEENIADASALAAMFETIWTCPKVVLGRVNGAAIGGGAGLVACCDLAIAADTARFGFGEVKIGLIPAVIAQYVVPKIGVSQARALFVSGERFSAERAFEIGLIHGVVPPEELDATVMEIAQRCLTSAPEAIVACKRVVDIVWESERDAARRFVIEMLARVRTSDEAREGIAAFKARRRPPWAV
ncbi:MAG: enoyl-CoA hydratase-related protein [Roseiflexus sp.]|nr:enoyl-CoA hydratase-related protein [Roseiflexus sp.]MCS7288410.1 enoyl-CoA hydratase-related protein [Roseiflexus sp.]MDW8146559.1 enoyl-CoA hydratase-related protein [Roseiflexaceae bacterium]MDW8231161.1 enoyl-CoA hydratase-related protein [Roseiflexaceae bacterium]